MNKFFRISPLLLVLLMTGMAGFTQNISMPYSIIGIGDIESSYYNRNSGMANTGFALRSGKNIFMANPASYSGLDNQLFTFEIAAQGKTVSYKGDPVTKGEDRNGDVAIKRISAAFKLSNRWGTAVSLSPYSSVNYLVARQKDVIGGGTTTSVIDGNGGINQIMLGNGYQLFKNHLSIGINAAFLFGSVTQTENLYDVNSQTAIAGTLNSYYRKLNLTYGMQYTTARAIKKKKYDYNLGLTFTPQNSMNGETRKSALSNGSEILKDEILKDRNFTLPATYGVGIAVIKNRRLTYAADFKYQDWERTRYKKENVSLVNSQRISGGVDYSSFKIEKDRSDRFFERERYNLQAGVFFNNSQIRMNGKQLQEYGITIGAGKPVSGGKINLNSALEFGTRGTTQMNLVKENYVQFTLIISYRDILYTKGRKYE